MSQSNSSTTKDSASGMLARTWVIAARYNDPADYGIPTLPTWTVSRMDDGGIALAANPDADPFIRAEQPVAIRR